MKVGFLLRGLFDVGCCGVSRRSSGFLQWRRGRSSGVGGVFEGSDGVRNGGMERKRERRGEV